MESSHEPPENTSEYSGPYEGDERDPVQLGAILPETTAEIKRRAESDLATANRHYIELENDRAAGKPVTDEELQAAKIRIMELQQEAKDD
jgi:hypothetical protein